MFYKLGGMNSVLALEDKKSMPLVQQKATLILGLDVWHGSAGRYDSPSIAAVRWSSSISLYNLISTLKITVVLMQLVVTTNLSKKKITVVKEYFLFLAKKFPQVVGSRCWPSISKYRASVRTQAPEMELIDSLCIPKPNGYDDDGIIRCHLIVKLYVRSS